MLLSTTDTPSSSSKKPPSSSTGMDIIWPKAARYALVHALGALGLWRLLHVQGLTLVALWFWYIVASLGVSAGVHRLWAHGSFRATAALHWLLACMFASSAQGSVDDWVRVHRVHHRHSDTDLDPQNIHRGLVFAQFGWFLLKPSAAVKQLYDSVDMTDLEAIPAVRFQNQHFRLMSVVCGFLLPAITAWMLWGEPLLNGVLVLGSFKHVLSINITGFGNSICHSWGRHTYQTGIRPTDNNVVGWLSPGEGDHNYHHAFPWDYRGREAGNDLTSRFIKLCATLGLAYDLKSPSDELVQKRALRTGDGTRAQSL